MIPKRGGLSNIFYGWIIVGVTFLIGATEAGVFQNILSVFLKPMADTFGWSRATISATMMFGSIGGGLISPFFGPILDRHGTRMVAFFSVFVLSAGLMSLAFLNHIWQLYVFFGVGRMVAVGILSLVISVSVANWFIRFRGRAMGIASLGPRMGAAVLPAFVQYFILTQGWRFAWVALGMLVFLMSGLPSLLFLRRRPEDFDLLPDGDTEVRNKEARNLKPRETHETDASPTADEPVWTRRQALRNTTFWHLTVITSLIPMAQAGFNFHLFPFMTDQGISATIGIALISTFAVLGSVGAISTGIFSERFNPQALLAINAFASGIIFYGFYALVSFRVRGTGGITLLFILSALNGFFHGGRLPLSSIIWADYFGRHSLGSIQGLSSPFRWTANAVGPIFAALFFDFSGSYTIPFHLFVILFLIAGVFSASMSPPNTGR